ncbi:type II toxin-antitoxin system Phd/YefM family antitoxin [Halomonas sp. AOP27-A1-41]|uniref:type II toxin-antitoxin system Phd/YefM family antitoxin n=1 Tax=Halomonas sp. AOP27-A1-41 TaxID=3457707 RepID=UPI0040347C43
MRTETISFLKQNAASLDLTEPMVITQNGRPAYVVEAFYERKKRDQAIALAKLIAFGERSRARGETMSIDDVREGLRKKYRNPQKESPNGTNLRGST